MRTITWSPWDGGELPPWMGRFYDPVFDECAAADAEQDAARATPYAAARAERFGLLSQWRYELLAGPQAPAENLGWPPLDVEEITARLAARRAAMLDDEITCARRRQVLAELPDRRGTWTRAHARAA